MSVRSFTVFQDIHDDHCPRTAPTDTATTLLSTLAAIEKENLHPVTGQRAGPTTVSEAKKRKTAALTTKLVPAPAAKKQKELKGEPKKTRKPPSKHRSTDSAKSSSSKSSRSRKASPLPPVVEEQEQQRQLPRLSTSQIDINSRCYELTVSPLADVSEAYDHTRSGSQEPDVHTEKEASVEPATCDYFSPTADQPLPKANGGSPTADDASRQNSSTPERKRVSSTFTFSSPSPTSERFRQARMSPSRDLIASRAE